MRSEDLEVSDQIVTDVAATVPHEMVHVVRQLGPKTVSDVEIDAIRAEYCKDQREVSHRLLKRWRDKQLENGHTPTIAELCDGLKKARCSAVVRDLFGKAYL